MRFLTVAILALMVWALPSAAAQAATPDPASASAAASAAVKKRALKKALKKCRTIRKTTRRKACVRKARKRFATRPSKPVEPKPGKTWTVDVIDKAFTPSSLTIKQGDSILWIWNDMNKEAHDVKLESGPPGINRADYATSNTPSINYQWSRRLDKTGTWVFYCSIHYLMRMTVKVGK